MKNRSTKKSLSIFGGSFIVVCLLLLVTSFSVFAAVGTPVNLTAADKNQTTVAFYWTPVANATAYDVYVNGVLNGQSLKVNNILTSHYIARNLNPATEYSFSVVAKIGEEASAMSAVLKVTTNTLIQSGNVALGSVATASGQYNMGFGAGNAVDGTVSGWINITPVWLSGGSAPYWLKVDLGVEKSVNEFIVYHGGANSKYPGVKIVNYKIQGSNDNAQWNDLVTVTDNTQTLTTHQIDTVTYRYIRVYTEDTTGAIICELKIMSEVSVGTPVNLTAADKNDSIVAFYWAPVANATAYDVYVNGVLNGQSLKVNNILTSHYIARNLNSLTEYSFSVVARIGASKSAMSSVLKVTTYDLGQSVNVALGCSAAESDKINNSFVGANAFDGTVNGWINIRPMWFSDGVANVDHWISVDIGEATEVSRFILSHGPMSGYAGHAETYLRDFNIQGSNDNATWNNLVEVRGNITTTQTIHDIEPVSYRYFRVLSLAAPAGSGNAPAICELKIMSASELAIGDILFTDSDGVEIDSLLDKNMVKAKVEIANYDISVPFSGVLVIGLYVNDTTLANVEHVPIDLSANTRSTLYVPIDIPTDGISYTAKAFLWSDFINIKPLQISNKIN